MRFLWWGRPKTSQFDPLAAERERPYVVVGGRRRVRDIPYALPNDIDEQKRLDLQHFMVRQTLRGNYAAPLNKQEVHEILDVGSGTGRWGMEIAQEFLGANVIGVDPAEPVVDMGAILGYGLERQPDKKRQFGISAPSGRMLGS